MARIFLSHSSRNNDWAIYLRDWLVQNGWDDIFLDLDPQKGLAPGENWQEALKAAAHRCEAVIVLISTDWLASPWCRAELQTAKLLGKRIVPVLISQIELSLLPVEITADSQVADVVRDPLGFERLKEGLRRAGLDSTSFPFAAGRRPYPGLEPLTEEDAAIFFGREAHVVRGLDQLRAMRDAGVERALVILGASGAGKSCFLRAGLVPRLKRDDRNFVVLPVVRPERGVLSGKFGLAAALEAALAAPHVQARLMGSDVPRTRARIRDLLLRRADGLETIIEAIRAAATVPASAAAEAAPAPPTIVLAIDQAEELFNEDGRAEAEPFLDLLAHAFAKVPGLLALIALRSDAYPRLQEEPRLAGLAQHPFNLPPMLEGSYRVIVEGPSRLVAPPLKVEPGLVDALLSDAKGPDALPLLAFTLERLYQDYGAGGTLTLAAYQELGGIAGALDRVIREVKLKARDVRDLPADPAALDALLRRTFLPHLVRVTAADEFARRIAPVEELPAAARSLVDLLVAHRLLIRDRRPTADGAGETDVVEVAHEALLREWRALAGWLDEEKAALRTIEAVGRASRDWSQRERSAEWLLHKGGRLQEAQSLAARPEFSTRLGVVGLGYLTACRAAEMEAEQADAARLAREHESAERAQRVRRRVMWTSAWVGLLLLLGSASELNMARSSMDSDARAFSVLAAQALKDDDHDSAMLYALAALPPTGAILPIPREEPEALLAEAASRSRLVGTLGHQDSIWHVALSPDGSRIATASRDKTAAIWDLAGRKLIKSLEGHTEALPHVAFSPDGGRIITSSFDKTARVWDGRTFESVAILQGHADQVFVGRFSPDGKVIATGSSDRTVRLWDGATHKELAVLEGHRGSVWDVAFDPTGRRLATASTDETVRIWDVESRRAVLTIAGHDAIWAVTFSPDGRWLATGSSDTTVRLWDAETGEPRGVLAGHKGRVRGLAYSSNGKRLISASMDGTAVMWDLGSRSVLATFRTTGLGLESIALHPDGRLAVAGGNDNLVRLWDLSERAPAPTIRWHDQEIWRLSVDSEGTRVAAVSGDREAVVWDMRTGQRLAALQGRRVSGGFIAFSPDDRLLLAGAGESALEWDAASGKVVRELTGHRGEVRGVAFSPDGRMIATSSSQGSIRIWDAASGQPIASREENSKDKDNKDQGREIRSIAFNPDGTQVVTAAIDGTAAVWDASTLTERVKLTGHTDAVYTAAFSPDGKMVVTASKDKTARLWSAATGTLLRSLNGHRDRVWSATFSPDGKLVATVSGDSTARIWDAATGELLRVLVGHEREINQSAFTRAGGSLLTAADDGTIRQWAIGAIALSSGVKLRDHVCNTVLAATPAQQFTAPQMRLPVLDGRSSDMLNPCERTKRF